MHNESERTFTTKDIQRRGGCRLCGGGVSGVGGVSGGGSDGGGGGGGGRDGGSDGGVNRRLLGGCGSGDGAGIARPHGEKVQLWSDVAAPLCCSEGVFGWRVVLKGW